MIFCERSLDGFFGESDSSTGILERDGKTYIAGYGAVVYDGTPKTEYYLGDKTYERFAPEAFLNWKQTQPVECRYNHSKDHILGITPDTCELDMSNKGCFYRTQFDPTDSDHAKVRSKFDKKLIRGSSIGFWALDAKITKERDRKVITITKILIRDVGPVNTPAYSGASAMLRSADERALAAWEAFEKTAERREIVRRLHK
jgi:HK97 family phage prohead protease